MSFLSDSFHLFVRWMKKLVRNPILIFFSLFQPVIFLVLFTQLFSSFGQLLATQSSLRQGLSCRTPSPVRFSLARRWLMT